MKLRILRPLFLVCSLLWQTVQGADYHDVRLGRRQGLETYIGPVTATVTVFTQFTVTETATVTVTPTGAVITKTVVSTESTTATEVTTVTTCVVVGGGGSGSGRRRRRDDGDDGVPSTTTSTTTVWQFPDATETLVVTATDLQSALQVTATQVVTEVVVVIAEQTVRPFATPLPIPSSSNGSYALDVVKDEEVQGVHLAIVLGAVFGSVIGAIALFVAGFLWTKKREERLMELEEVAGVPAGGGGGGGGGGRVAGLLGSVLGSTRSSTHYNTIPDAAMVVATSHQLPPQLPPVDLDPPGGYSFDLHYDSTSQLPALHIPPPLPPPRHPAFAAREYTFGSPVSSISERYMQTPTPTTGQEAEDQASWPPPPGVLSPMFEGERGLSLAPEP